MLYKINAYFAVLLITIAGAVASSVIINVAYANTFTVTLSGGGAYPNLQPKHITPKQ